VALLLAASPAHAQTGMGYGMKPVPGDRGPKEPEGVAFTQKLGSQVPLDLEFYDHNNEPVTLRQCVGGKPTVFVLAYYRCPKLCNQVLTSVLDALKQLRAQDAKFTAGQAFNVVVVSIDPRESAMGLARPKRLEFLKNYLTSEDVPENAGWWFLTANHGQGTDVNAADRKIHTLAKAVGFDFNLRARNKTYVFDTDKGEWAGQADGTVLQTLPRDYDYDHKSGIAILTPDGVVSRYLLGISYAPRDLRLALVEASGGEIGTLTDTISQYCYVYDDVKGHYKPTLRLTAVVAVPVMLAMFTLALLAVRQARREPPLKPGESAATPTPAAAPAADTQDAQDEGR
jgi:protein SCO1/2